MSQSIQWNFSLRIAGGPEFKGLRSLPIEACDVVTVSIIPKPTGGTPVGQKVEIQPSTQEGQLALFAVLSDRYSQKITYKINDGTAAFNLDEPLVLAGKGAIAFLGKRRRPPHLLFITI